MDADKEASRITEDVNRRIATECAAISGYLWKAKAEEIAEQDVPRGWEWQLFEQLGAPPQFVLMAYDPRSAT